jgi:hypothetical protein
LPAAASTAPSLATSTEVAAVRATDAVDAPRLGPLEIHNKWDPVIEAPSAVSTPLPLATPTEVAAVRATEPVVASPSAFITTSAVVSTFLRSASVEVASEAAAEAAVTHVESWIKVNKKGKTKTVVKTYSYDRADVDYEPEDVPWEAPRDPAAESADSADAVPAMAFDGPPHAGPPGGPHGHPGLHRPPPHRNSPGIPFSLIPIMQELHEALEEVRRRKAAFPVGHKDHQAWEEDEKSLLSYVNKLDAWAADPGNGGGSANVHELEMIFGIGTDIVTATWASSPVPALLISSQTVALGGPAATIGGNVVSMASAGLVMPSQTIALQALMPIRPTDYAAVVPLSSSGNDAGGGEGGEPSVTFIRPAGNPGVVTAAQGVTLTAGGAPYVTGAHSIFYNSWGDVVVDGTHTIEPSPTHLAGAPTPAPGVPLGRGSSSSPGGGGDVFGGAGGGGGGGDGGGEHGGGKRPAANVGGIWVDAGALGGPPPAAAQKQAEGSGVAGSTSTNAPGAPGKTGVAGPKSTGDARLGGAPLAAGADGVRVAAAAACAPVAAVVGIAVALLLQW